VNLPDRNGREAILKVHTRGVPLAGDADLVEIAASTPGLSGADLRNLVNEAETCGGPQESGQQAADFPFSPHEAPPRHLPAVASRSIGGCTKGSRIELRLPAIGAKSPEPATSTSFDPSRSIATAAHWVR
jgi:hypothetical protein